MTDTDLIAQADAAIDRVVNAPQGIVDPLYVARSASLVPALRDALAAQLDLFRAEVARRQRAEDALAAALTRAELAECHAEALEAERDRLRGVLGMCERVARGQFVSVSEYDQESPFFGSDMSGDHSDWGRGIQRGREQAASAIRAALTGETQP